MISKGICQFVGRHGGADVLEDKQPPLVYKLSSSQTLDNTDKMDEVTFMTLNSLYVKWHSSPVLPSLYSTFTCLHYDKARISYYNNSSRSHIGISSISLSQNSRRLQSFSN